MPANFFRRLFLATGVLLCLLVHRAPAQHDFSDWRGLWLTRFDYRSTNEATVRHMIDNVASLGITDLMFQVRGQSDAYYNSNFEPRSHTLAPGWDPLAVAIDQAHAHGINLHAWINTMPLWNGTTPPPTGTTPEHPYYHEDPDYRIFDTNGNPQPLGSGYVIANPILPEWHQHVDNVVNDIVTQYNVDGVHLDYTRWLGSSSWSELPHDAQSHAMFTADTGLAATSSNANQYRDYIRRRITDLVTSVNATMDATDPNAVLSAAVWRDPDVGNSQVLQNYRTWMQQDLVDVIIPMIYLSESNNHLFEPNLLNVMSINTNARVAPGIGVYLHDDPQFTVSQLQTLVDNNTGGATLFAYSSFFSSGQLGMDRFNAVKTYLDSVAGGGDPGNYLRITDFESGEGYFSSSPTFSGSNIGIISASADRVTTHAFDGMGAQEITVLGDSNGWFLRHVSGIGSPSQIASPAGNLPLDPNGFVGFWLKTSNSGLEVSLALDDPVTADRGLRQPLIADGQWHLYEWNLEDNSEWEGWVNGDGLITGPTVSLDSIQFWGAGVATIYLDEVGHNPDGSILDIFITGDFNRDGIYDITDIDALTAAIVDGVANQAIYDLNRDGTLDVQDVTEWLAEAGANNLASGNSYRLGDANLDGIVDGQDFLNWNAAKFTSNSAWSSGNFNADGIIDGPDFLVWNENKFQSADHAAAAVPEPAGMLLWCTGLLVLGHRTRR